MNDTMTQPPPSEPVSSDAPATTQSSSLPAAPAARTRLGDRLFGFRSLLATGIAGVILGGAVGTAVTLVADDHGPGGGPGDHPARMGFPGGPGGPGDPRGPGGPRG